MDSANKPATAPYESLGYRVHKDEVSLGLPLWAQPDRADSWAASVEGKEGIHR
jgi:hypothetical protein